MDIRFFRSTRQCAFRPPDQCWAFFLLQQILPKREDGRDYHR